MTPTELQAVFNKPRTVKIYSKHVCPTMEALLWLNERFAGQITIRPYIEERYGDTYSYLQISPIEPGWYELLDDEDVEQMVGREINYSVGCNHYRPAGFFSIRV